MLWNVRASLTVIGLPKHAQIAVGKPLAENVESADLVVPGRLPTVLRPIASAVEEDVELTSSPSTARSSGRRCRRSAGRRGRRRSDPSPGITRWLVAPLDLASGFVASPSRHVELRSSAVGFLPSRRDIAPISLCRGAGEASSPGSVELISRRTATAFPTAPSAHGSRGLAGEGYEASRAADRVCVLFQIQR